MVSFQLLLDYDRLFTWILTSSIAVSVEYAIPRERHYAEFAAEFAVRTRYIVTVEIEDVLDEQAS